jgi:predicted TPR repeat methyltransferase
LQTDAQYREALALYDRDDFAHAADAFERVLLVSPNHVECRYKLANARKEMGDWHAAVMQYEKVIGLDPSHAEAFNNLGAALQALGRGDEAEASYRRSMLLRPSLAQPYLNLGRLLQAAGRTADAAGIYKAALAGGLDAGLFGHLLSAASGGAAQKAPEAYVRETFDAFASQFDRHLTGTLDYRVPERLARLMEQPGEVLDLGCGTGLVGEALSGRARRLVGVDLSPRMLETAKRRGCYAELHEADIEQWLAQCPDAAFDWVIAADVFIYIGQLENVFANATRVLRRSGSLGFSVEATDGADWQLLPSGRYAHSNAYIECLFALNGLRAAASERVMVRHGVPGYIHVAAK